MNVVECDREILQKRLVRGLAMGESAASARHYQQGRYRETDGKPHSHCAFLCNLTKYRLLPTADDLSSSERRDSPRSTRSVCDFLAREVICGCCPHPRAPGALALSLDRERDLEMDTETEPKQSQTRRRTALPG